MSLHDYFENTKGMGILAVSTAFFLSTGMRDIIAFIAGIVYGIITEYVAYRLE